MPCAARPKQPRIPSAPQRAPAHFAAGQPIDHCYHIFFSGHAHGAARVCGVAMQSRACRTLAMQWIERIGAGYVLPWPIRPGKMVIISFLSN